MSGICFLTMLPPQPCIPGFFPYIRYSLREQLRCFINYFAGFLYKFKKAASVAGFVH
jgi:hypothetical protein